MDATSLKLERCKSGGVVLMIGGFGGEEESTTIAIGKNDVC
jgi:hypothetical protein